MRSLLLAEDVRLPVESRQRAILARMIKTRALRFHSAVVLCLVFILFSANCVRAGIPSTPDRPPVAASALVADAPILTGLDFAGLTTEEALLLAQPLPRDLADMAIRLDPSIGAIPQVFHDAPPDYAVGDRLDFWVQNSSTAEFTLITAELIHKTDVAYAWVQVGESFDGDAIAESVDHFSAVIYPAVRAAFGEEASPGVDNDPRVHILHTTGLGPNVAGYFLGGDEYSSQVLPHSNQKEMFYMSLNWLNNVGYGEAYEEVLAHEFQHMIHNNHDETEQAWVNEGLSETAKQVAGYSPLSSFAFNFAMNPQTQLNDWGGANANNSAHYGAAFLFMHYLAQRFGDDIFGKIVAEPLNGMAGIDAVLQRAPYSTTAEAIFGDWVIANAVNDQTPDAEGRVRWGYPELPFVSTQSRQAFDEFVVQIDGEISNFTAETHLLRDDGSGWARTIEFWSPAQTTLAPFTVESGDRFWWSNRVDNSETRLTRHFDLGALDAGTPVTMTARMAFDIEPDYDYGYLMASRDGVQWTILPGDYTTDVNPSGMNLGDAYTGVAPESESPDDAVWVTDHYDLSEYAGGDLWLRFTYVTDDAVTAPGWAIDEVSIPAIGYDEDFIGRLPVGRVRAGC
jgi:immune inhibitor A